MIVDDHAVLREGLRLLLESKSDISVVAEAADGRSALRMVPEARPDVVLLDIGMRGMNGIAAAEELRRDYPNVKVVMLSMYANTEHVYRALAAGSRGYVLKDSRGEELVQAIRAVSADNRFFSPEIMDMIAEGFASQPPPEQGASPALYP